jgi:hypothetical protein
MFKLTQVLLLIATSSSLPANTAQLSQARSDLLVGNLTTADQALATIIASTPQNTEARLLKCLSEIGLFVEDDLADFLINSLGADASRTAEALDISKLLATAGSEMDPSLPIIDRNNPGSELYQWTRPSHSGSSNSGSRRLGELFNYSIESESTVGMIRESGTFSTPDGVRRCAISFRFTGDIEEQVDFQLSFSHSNYSAPLKAYFNGIEIGQFESGWGYMDLGDSSAYLSGDYVSVRMQPGDLISFEVEQESNSGTTEMSPTELTIKAIDPWVLEFENGVLYTSYFPEIQANANLSDLRDFLLRGNDDFGSLLTSIKSHLEAIPVNGSATFLPSDTGMPVDLIVEAADVQMLLAAVDCLHALQVLSDAYDYALEISQTNYQELLDGLRTVEDFKRLLPSLFECRDTPDAQVTQAKDLVASALNRYLNNEAVFWNRTSGLYSSYLFEIDSTQEALSQQDWSSAVTSAISSLSNYTPAANISPSVKSGYEFTLAPLFGATAFDFKDVLLGVDWDRGEGDDYTPYDFFAENGFTRKLLPRHLDGMCLVRFNQLGEVHQADLIYASDAQVSAYRNTGYYWYYDDQPFDPFDGSLVLAPSRTTLRYTSDAASDDTYEYIQLSADTTYGGTWDMLESGSETTVSGGRYVFYPGVLDMDNDGMPDGQQLIQGFRVLPPASLSSNAIAQSAYGLSTAHQPASLGGKILVTDADPSSLSTDSMGHYDLPDFYALQLNSNSKISFRDYRDTTTGAKLRYLDYHYSARTARMLLDEHDPDPARYNPPGAIVTFYKSTYEGAGFSFPTSDNHHAGQQQAKYFNFSLYPASLDLDKDGLTDGDGIALAQDLDLDQLPRRIDIETTANQGVDADEDGLPDLLEAKFGGSGTDPNDTHLTAAYLIENDLYTESEAQSLSVTEGINQVVNNPASYNLYTADSIKELNLSRMTIGPIYGNKIDVSYTIEESQTLGEWSTFTTGTIEMPITKDINFVRMRVGD